MPETPLKPQPIAATLVEGSRGQARLIGYRGQQAARAASASHNFFTTERHFGADAWRARGEQYFSHFQAARRAHQGGRERVRALTEDAVLMGWRWGTTVKSFVPGIAISAAFQTPGAREVLGGAVAAARGISELERQGNIQRDVTARIQEGRNLEVIDAAEAESEEKTKGPAWWKEARGKLAGVGARFSEAHRQATVAARLSGELDGVTDTLYNYRSEREGEVSTAMNYIADANEIVKSLSPYLAFDKDTATLSLTERGKRLVSMQESEELTRRDITDARMILVDLEARLRFFERDENAGDFTFSLLNAPNGQMDVETTYKSLRELRDLFVPSMMTSAFEFQVDGRILSLESARRKIRKGMRNDRLAHGIGATAVSLVGVNVGIEAGTKLHELWEAHGEGVRDFAGNVAGHAHEMVDQAGRAVGNLWENARQAGMSAQEFALAVHVGGQQRVAAMLRGTISPEGGKVHKTVGRLAQHAQSLREHLTGHAGDHPLEALPQQSQTGVHLNADNAVWDNNFNTEHGLHISPAGVISQHYSNADPLIQRIQAATGGSIASKEVIFAKVNGKWEMFPMSDANSLHFPAGTEVSSGFVTGPNYQALDWSQIANGDVPPGGHVVRLATSYMPKGVTGGNIPPVPAPQTPHIPVHDSRAFPTMGTAQTTVSTPPQVGAPSSPSGIESLPDAWNQATPGEQAVIGTEAALAGLAGTALAATVARGIHAISQRSGGEEVVSEEAPYDYSQDGFLLAEPEPLNLEQVKAGMVTTLRDKAERLQQMREGLGEEEWDRQADLLAFDEAMTNFVDNSDVDSWAPFLLAVNETARYSFLNMCPDALAVQVERTMSGFIAQVEATPNFAGLTNEEKMGRLARMLSDEGHLRYVIDPLVDSYGYSDTLLRALSERDVAFDTIIMQILSSRAAAA